MKLHYLLLLCAFALAFGSCKYNPGGASGGTSVEQLFPLAYGNYWVYNAQDFNADGTLRSDTTLTIEVFGTQTFRGREAYQSDFGGGGGLLYYSGSDIYSAGSDSSSAQIFLRYPMNIGQTLVLRDTTYSFGYHDREVLIFRGQNELVNVPAGNFYCYRYDDITMSGQLKVLDTSGFQSLYFASGVGLVQDRVFSKDSGKLVMAGLLQLSSYRVK